MKRFTYLTTLLLALTLFVPASPLASEKAADASLSEQIRECRENVKGLSVLFLTDHSMSLNDTDPNNARVGAIKATVESLQQPLGKHNTQQRSDSSNFVFVAFLQFGSYPRQVVADSSAQNDLWHKLSGASNSNISRTIKGLGEIDKDGDTDYLGALRPASPYNPDYRDFREKNGISPIGAIEALNRAPQNTCKLIIWFSDGQHDIEDKSVGQRKFFWDRQTTEIPLFDEEKAKEITEQTKARLCEPGGLVDELRGHGRSMNDGRTFVATVGLSTPEKPQEFDLLKRIAEGKDEKGQTCGGKIDPAIGKFFPARGPYAVVHALGAVVDPTKTNMCEGTVCKRIENFEVDASWSRFTLAVTAGNPKAQPELISPNGVRYRFPLGGDPLEEDLVKIGSQGFGIYSVSAEAPQETVDGWAGTWRVDFGVDNPDGQISLGIRSDIKLRLDSWQLRQGKEGQLKFVLETARGIGDLPFDKNRLSVDKLHVYLDDDLWGTRDNFDVSGKSPAAGTVECQVHYKVSYILPTNKVRIAISEDRTACGTIDVAQPASYPTIRPYDLKLLPKLDNDEAPVTGSFEIVAENEEEYGCVHFQDQKTPKLDEKGLKLVLKSDQGQKIPEGEKLGCLSAPGSKKFHLEVSVVDPTKLGGPDDYTLEGKLAFTTISDIDDEKRETLPPVRFSLTVAPPTTSHTPWLEVILWVLGSLALPVLFLYLYNFLRGSRFSKTGPLFVADVPIRFTAQGIAPALGRTDVVSDQDLVLHAGIAAPTRSFKVTVDNTTVAIFRGRVPLWPHVSPHASVSRPNTPQAAVFSELGSDSDLSMGRLRPSLTYAWVVSINPPDPSSVENNAELVGRLLLITPVLLQDTQTAPAADLNHAINEQFDVLGDDIRKWERQVGADQAHTSSETASRSPNHDLSAFDDLPDNERPTRQIGDLPDESLGPDIDLPELPD